MTFKRRLVLLAASLMVVAAGMPTGSAAAAGPTTLPGLPVTAQFAGRITADQMKAREQQGPVAPAMREGPRLQPGRANLPQAPGSEKLRTTLQPQAASGVGPRNPQTPGTQFLGATFADGGAWPPDTMGAVGPTQFIVFVNNRVRSFNKTTGAADTVLNHTPETFFAPSLNPSDFASDPHIRYDRLSGRWFVSMISVPNTMTHANNRVMVAVSSTSNITGGTVWSEVYYDITNNHPGCLWDYDTLGIDSNALYLGGNLFCGNPQQYSQSRGLVLHKAPLVNNTPSSGTDFFLSNPFGAGCPYDGAYSPQGVDSYDGSTVGYFVGVSVCFFSKLWVIKITNPGGTASMTQAPVTVPTTYVPGPTFGVTAQGSTKGLDALDDRLFAAHLRNGHLWTAHNLCVTSSGVADNTCDRAAARWYDLINLASTPALGQSGTVFDNAVSNPRNFWIPSIMVSGQGDAAMGVSVAGGAEHAEAAALGRLANDATGTMQAATVYQTSTFTYNPSDSTPANSAYRWGDYSYTSLDPNDDMTMWTIQEFANATNSWGVEAVQLKAPPPVTPATVSGGTIYADRANRIVHVTGPSISGSGYFDPGVGFPNRLQASVSGGVVVNSVTVVDPTHLDLNLSTGGVTPGTQNLTITNPDGQFVTMPNFLTVAAAPPLPTTVQQVKTQQYTLSNSDGVLWTEIDPALQIPITGAASTYTLLTANADLFTGDAGYNQDIGIFYTDNGGADTLLAWKESGGFAGIFSPNAAFVQFKFDQVAGHNYIFKLKWKTNKPATGKTIFAGAGPQAGPISPTSLIAKTFPVGVQPNFAVRTQQYTLPSPDGTAWTSIDATNLAFTVTATSDSTAVLGANVDLFTGDSGVNQDIGIKVTDNGSNDQLVGWKESGGFAGIFSPNAAFLKATWPMVNGHTYVFRLVWKANNTATGKTIFAGAGPQGGPISNTSLFAETIVDDANPYVNLSTAQTSLANSDGSTWMTLGSQTVTLNDCCNANVILGANADLWTANAGKNQDIAIFVSVDGAADVLLAWKESGGFAGTFSPNAAFVQFLYHAPGITVGHLYVFKLKWKTNLSASGATIYAGAGPLSGLFSPTRLTAELTN